MIDLRHESPMKIETWLEQATQDVERRGLAALRPLLEGLARSTAALRAADWNRDLSGTAAPPSTPNVR
jgi:hypothetical protein